MDDFEMTAILFVGIFLTIALACAEYVYTNNVTGRSLVPFALLLIYILVCQLVEMFTDLELYIKDIDDYHESEEE